ncbi:hypothetical protein [Quadrisphaera setariae]|uniref:Pre-peptidase C-terminal domain-containing protein n=1 Tax=Quadrisphaera setariae TaxID=2593304 RepID=A0A5C8ZJ33_9ACTN|nr:hypothetical protein [Quadrisphaera setariae]TXR57149.1 hypothetical protein FMM08_06730 [Quadrisphaera setariae]
MRSTPVLVVAAALVAATVAGGPALAAVAAPVPAAASTAVSAAARSTTPVRFAPGATAAAVRGHLAAGSSRTYALDLRAEQVLEVSFQRGSTTQAFTLVAPDGTPLHTDHGQDQSGGTFVVPVTGTYLLAVRSGAGAGAGAAYALHLTVPQQLRFAPGATSTSVRGQLPAGDDHPYSFAARAGQRATVSSRASRPDAVWFLVGPDGSPLHTDHTSAQQGSTTVQLPVSGTYRLDVRSGAATSYELALSVPR